MDQTLADLLMCPACSGDFLPGNGAVCDRCGAEFPVDDGIVSLIGEGAHTTLDDIDYDAVYKVDAAASLVFAESCMGLLRDRLPSRLDAFLEIGAGTGLFTLGFLKQVPTAKALITDISPTMLKTCRRRLYEHGVANRVELQFAAWDGASCLRPHAFDLIAGFSVLHHVLDFQAMLRTLREALRPDGVALFLEPNYRFHVALIDTVCEIYTSIADDDGTWTSGDRNHLSAWLFENNINLRFRGDEYVLAGREDKHLFDGTQLAAAARDAGFDHVELVPFGERGECYVALKVYSNQIGLTDAARNDLLVRFSRMLPGHFAHLADEDLAPSTLILLRRGSSPGSRPSGSVGGSLRGGAPPAIACDVTITVTAQDDHWAIKAEGWLLGDMDVNYLALDLNDCRHMFPVQWMRQDVNRALNSARIHPLRRALFSGISATLPQPVTAIVKAQTASLLAIAADGREFVIRELVIEPGPGTYTVTQVDKGYCRPC